MTRFGFGNFARYKLGIEQRKQNRGADGTGSTGITVIISYETKINNTSFSELVSGERLAFMDFGESGDLR